MSESWQPTIQCSYSCALCGIVWRVVDVVAREPGQDVHLWMNQMIVALAEDHRSVSPGCHPETLKDVRIPYTDGGVGFPPRN